MLQERQVLPNVHIVRQPRLTGDAKEQVRTAADTIRRQRGARTFAARRELGVTVFPWKHLVRLNPDPYANLTDVRFAIYDDLPDTKNQPVSAAIYPARVYQNSTKLHIAYPVRAAALTAEHHSIRATCEKYGLAVPRQSYDDFHISIGSFALNEQVPPDAALDTSIDIANQALQTMPTVLLGGLAIHTMLD